MRDRAEEVRTEGPLEPVKSLRDFKPADRVAARLEISTGGLLRGRTAGVDVMGDGSLVPFTGGMRRDQLPRETHETAFEAVERELGG
jgi:hypothetical protein